MTKKLTALLLALILLVGLAACDSVTGTSAPTGGVWESRVFTSEFLGFRFVLPPTWEVPTDLQASVIMAHGESAVFEAGIEIPEDIDFHADNDMMAVSAVTGASVQIRYLRHGGRRRGPSSDQVIEILREQMEGLGFRTTLHAGTTRIGDHDWYSIGTAMEMFGATAYGRQFFNVHRGYIRAITVAYFPEESLETILSMFIGLDDQLPEIPAIQHAEHLVDTWYWDMDDDYAYVFNADGTGTRGFSGALERFGWRTHEDVLIITAITSIESWEFSVVGDVLSLSNVRVPALFYRYIRSGGVDHGFTTVFEDPATEYGQAVEFVGVWEWDGNNLYNYIFNADGTGLRGWPRQVQEFRWRTGGNHLIMEIDGMTESWTFTITGNVLTIDNRQWPETYSYIRIGDDGQESILLLEYGHAEEFIGTWEWDEDNAYIYVFNADGTGTRGWPGQIESFEWLTAGDHLIMLSAFMAESWTFIISGDVLTIDSRQWPDVVFSYIRQQPGARHEI